jgi:hypothetical protein
MDFLARRELALETLLCHLNKEMECRVYAEPYQLAAHPNQSCYVCASEIGWALDRVRGKRGYAAYWLLSQLLVPAATLSHPHINRGGDKGLMAPSLPTEGAATPSLSLAQNSMPAH